MKRNVLILMLASFAYLQGSAQPKENFGIIAPEEASLTECAFDSGAVAVILADEGYSDFTDAYGLMTWQHSRIKILKEDGKKYANVRITYRSEDDAEYIDQIKAMIINFDEHGKRTDIAVDKKSIYKRKVNDRTSEVTFAFPDAQVGSVIEYQYRINAKSYNSLRDWFFQSDIPVYKSSYDLKVVPTREISYLVQYNKKYQIKAEPNKSSNSVYFEMKNLPALTDEPYMDARRDYVQKVIFQTTQYSSNFGTSRFMSNWNEVTRELYSREDFGRQLKIDIDECQQYAKSAVEGKSDYEKMRLIHRFVVDNTKWNGVTGVVTSDGIRNLWKTKNGTAAEINLLLVNMLQTAGLDVFPMLASERWAGRINKSTPFIQQFNKVYAAVTIDGKRYFLDGTDKFTPFYLTPYSILNTSAFITNNKKGGIVDVSEDNLRYRDILSIDAEIDAQGEYKGNVQLISKDYARALRLEQFSAFGKEEYISKEILRGFSNVSIDSFKFENESIDTLPLKHSFQFKTSIQKTGDYSFISFNLFTGYEANPFLISNRFSTVNFGFKKSLNENCVIRLSENMKVDALPKNVKLTNADGTVVFTREFYVDDQKHQLVARMKVDINKSMFTVDEYDELREFYKKMISLMNEQVVLKQI